MFQSDRHEAIYRLLLEHVRSPSLKHIREPRILDQLAVKIAETIERSPPVWTKWIGDRESLVRAASDCWIPVPDLRSFLNTLPGPKLTETDVAQRLRAIHEEPFSTYPDERLKAACVKLFEREKAAGTEMPAIILALQEFVEGESARQRQARETAWKEQRIAEQQALEQRFLAGADCKWTTLLGSRDFYTRKNGRAYRLTKSDAKRLDLFRITGPDDGGKLLGTYRSRGEASRALSNLAYTQEPSW